MQALVQSSRLVYTKNQIALQYNDILTPWNVGMNAPGKSPRQRLALIDSLKTKLSINIFFSLKFSVISWWEIHSSTCWRVVHWARVRERVQLSIPRRAEHAGRTQRARRHAIFVP